jgi:glucose-6-phosphate isomerase
LTSGEAKTPALTAAPPQRALAAHRVQIKDVHLRTLFADDPSRAERFCTEGASLFLDYSKNRITDETPPPLLRLAEERHQSRRRPRARLCWPGTPPPLAASRQNHR